MHSMELLRTKHPTKGSLASPKASAKRLPSNAERSPRYLDFDVQSHPCIKDGQERHEDGRRLLWESRLLCEHRLYDTRYGSRSLLWRTGEGASRLSSPNTIVVHSAAQFNALLFPPSVASTKPFFNLTTCLDIASRPTPSREHRRIGDLIMVMKAVS
ncbi:hypothetical protein ARMSODRAFT_103832 [Armillaria solidipes]|uniref:Uncharacterized protein n=1 Tax=Armillaria solidipes TaxID=1076256 RepID=A0A2H3AIF2_9AGAR|nr:hypothetical protein ARMSODRAFT_103832 [Armillaria solidipes]